MWQEIREKFDRDAHVSGTVTYLTGRNSLNTIGCRSPGGKGSRAPHVDAALKLQ